MAKKGISTPPRLERSLPRVAHGVQGLISSPPLHHLDTTQALHHCSDTRPIRSITSSSHLPRCYISCSPYFGNSSLETRETTTSTSWLRRFAPARAAAPTWSTTQTAGSASTARTRSARKPLRGMASAASERGPRRRRQKCEPRAAPQRPRAIAWSKSTRPHPSSKRAISLYIFKCRVEQTCSAKQTRVTPSTSMRSS